MRPANVLRHGLLAGGMLAQLILFGGCAQFQSSTQELLNPPTLTREQAQIQTALTMAVGTTDLKYKYPQNGEYRSSFILYDIDGDAVNEALVFYQSSVKKSTWLNILDKQENGSWESVYEVSAPDSDSDVDFISFEQLSKDEGINVVVGWVDRRQSKTVAVYDYKDSALSEIFSQSYNELAFSDLDSNGTQDMVLMSPASYSSDSNSTLLFLATQQAEGFGIVSSLELARAVDSFAKVTPGRLFPGQNALFFDENITGMDGGSFQITDVVAAVREDDGLVLVNLLDTDTRSLSAQTQRPSENLFCRDADGDGLTEIPSLRLLPGYEDSDQEERRYLTSYNGLEGDKLIPKVSGVLNSAHRFMVTFPEKWIDKVTVVVQPENDEWIFVRYQDSLQDASVPLLRIRVYSSKDYRDKFENDYFKLIQTKGLFEYYAYIPPSADALKITEAELTGMFTFLE